MSETPVLSEAEQFDALVAARRAADAGEPPPDPTPQESPQEPAPEAGSVVMEAENPAAPESASEEIDLESLPPAVRARIEAAAKLEEDLKREREARLAAIGRVAPTQRDLTKANNELADLRQKLAQLEKPATQATPAANAAEPDYDSPEWKQYEAEFPNEAKAIRKVNEAQARRLAQAEARLAEFERRANERLGVVDRIVQDQTQTRELAVLTEAHPDWRELVLPPDEESAVVVDVPTRLPDGSESVSKAVVSADFAAWFQVQHPDKQRWFSSNSAAENIELVADFKRDLYLAQLHASAQEAPAAVTPEAAAAQRAHQRREQARASSVAPDLRGASPSAARVDTSKMNDADLFDHLARQRRANNR